MSLLPAAQHYTLLCGQNCASRLLITVVQITVSGYPKPVLDLDLVSQIWHIF